MDVQSNGRYDDLWIKVLIVLNLGVEAVGWCLT